MNVSIRHNGTTITSRVIAYSREHQICSGIGRLQLTLEGTYSTSISPHDTIDIYEEGDFKVRYYVSDASHNVPEGTIILECQDKSKYLVDYFIPDTYLIDYPSYTRYWIEKFLTEAHVSYSFETSSQGNLISNNTSLGLQPAYDQIMMLLQLSGWYMYFDGNGVAVIGSLDVDLADTAGSIGLRDILDIKKITDDKMLRNRAVVWGQYDPLRREYAYADVTKHTPWNYDHNDLRTMVVSNNNIPNKSSAYGIANILLKEFAKITIEKHITVWGARNYNLGESLRVNSHIWRGKGLITTFGVTLDRNGLVTNVILDERCPRLFGFFNFGDYVYVGTFGDGVWRKHIKFDPTWYNFSTGLIDLHITDLHINNGIFGSVDYSGGAYYANNETGPWNPITFSSLVSSQEDTVPSGGSITYIPFSGLMARAIIVDKEENTVKFGIDTYSGLNTGDYFLSFSGYTTSSGVTSSGVISSGVSSSGYRSWIVEYDPYTGLPAGGLGSGVYPVVYSGNYNFFVVDLENDGKNDYISVGTTGSGVAQDDAHDFGSHTTYQPYVVRDYNTGVGFSPLAYDLEGETNYQALTAHAATCYSVFHNEVEDQRDIVYQDTTLSVLKEIHFYKQFNVGLGRNEVLFSTKTSPSTAGMGVIYTIYKDSLTTYKIYHSPSPTSGAGYLARIIVYVRTWDTVANTFSGDTTLTTLDITEDPLKPSPAREDVTTDVISMGGKLFFYTVHAGMSDAVALTTTDIHNYVKVYLIKIDLETSAVEYSSLLQQVDFEDRNGSGSPRWRTMAWNAASPPLPQGRFVFQKGLNIHVAFFVRETDDPTSPTEWRSWLVKSEDGVSFEKVLVQNTFSASDADFQYIALGSTISTNQATENFPFIYGRASAVVGGKQIAYLYNGSTVFIRDHVSGIPYYCVAANVYPMMGNLHSEYAAFDGSSEWWWIDCATMLPTFQVLFTGYSISKPFSIVATDGLEQYYWYAIRTSDFKRVIINATRGGVINSVMVPFSQPTFVTPRGIVVGNIFIDSPTVSDTAGGTSTVLRVLYVDNLFPVTRSNIFYVLQREGQEFNLIQQASKPIRVDISNNSPVLTVQDNENTFQSNFVYDNTLTQVIPVSGLQSTQVRDFRYTLLETASGVIVGSGAGGVQQQILYVSRSGIYSSDAQTYSGGFVLFDEIPSGMAERIETSNYTYPGQFIFVTTSGDYPMFYQRDNDGLLFDAYSGLPASRATIIRLDDRF